MLGGVNHVLKLKFHEANHWILNLLTKKLVLPIWQSPNKLIFKATKSESKSFSLRAVLACSSNPKPASTASGGSAKEPRLDNRRYWVVFPNEQTIILSQMNRKNCLINETLSSTLHRILTWTTFRQSCVIFLDAPWINLAMKIVATFLFAHCFQFCVCVF